MAYTAVMNITTAKAFSTGSHLREHWTPSSSRRVWHASQCSQRFALAGQVTRGRRWSDRRRTSM
eukprot:1738389-Rhodomonas_salina.3